MTPKDITELFETAANTDIKKSANVQTMKQLVEMLTSDKISKDEAQLIVACTTISVSDEFLKTYPDEYKKCLEAYVKIGKEVKEAMQGILGKHWRTALMANPLSLTINL